MKFSHPDTKLELAAHKRATSICVRERSWALIVLKMGESRWQKEHGLQWM